MNAFVGLFLGPPLPRHVMLFLAERLVLMPPSRLRDEVSPNVPLEDATKRVAPS